MYVYTVCLSSQAEPKSMILMIGLSRLFDISFVDVLRVQSFILLE